jgi:hypothetical protein
VREWGGKRDFLNAEGGERKPKEEKEEKEEKFTKYKI